MSRRLWSSNPVSLFPFLAVLVSTMGSLVLLLLVVSRQAQLRRDQSAWERMPVSGAAMPSSPPLEEYLELPPLPPPDPQSERAPELPALPKLIDRRPIVRADRDKLQKQLAELRERQRTLAQDDPSQAQTRDSVLLDLKGQLERLTGDRDRRSRTLRALNQELADSEAQKRLAQQSANLVESRFAIIAYTGPHGTRRRPIFLECRAADIVLQPEGVRIGAELLERPKDRSNPLAAVVRAVMAKLGSADPDGPAYPLLLVRPDGIAGFYLAQQALEHLRVSFGYELLDSTIELEFPAPEAELRAVAQAVVDDAAERGRLGLDRWAESGIRGPRRGVPVEDVGKSSTLWGSVTTRTAGPPGESSDAKPEALVGLVSRLFDVGLAGRVRLETTGRTPSLLEKPVAGSAWGPRRAERNGEPDSGKSAVGRLSPSASEREGGTIDNSPEPAGDPSGAATSVADTGSTAERSERTGWQMTFEDPLFAAERRGSKDSSPPPLDAGLVMPGPPAPPDAVALPGPVGGRARVRRQIAVACRSDGLVLFPDGRFVPLSSDADTRPAVQELAQHIRALRAIWMRSTEAEQCQPVLVFLVAPDGLENYYRVRLALVGCGIPIHHRLVSHDCASLGRE